jgi:hypothetical protein
MKYRGSNARIALLSFNFLMCLNVILNPKTLQIQFIGILISIVCIISMRDCINYRRGRKDD